MASMSNPGLLETQDAATHAACFSFPTNALFSSMGFYQSHKPLPNNIISSPETLISSDTFDLIKHREEENSFGLGGAELLPLRKSTANHFWAFREVGECLNVKRNGEEDHNLGLNSMKMKKIKVRRKVREPRFCFKTMSDVDVLDDGYKWRKYGQKVVKNTQHPRSYYRCTQDNCRVKKRVERLAEDPRMVITTYEGRHPHSPSRELEDSQAPSNTFSW